MDNKTFNVIIESRYDTDSDWKSIDPVLREGELAVVYIKSDLPKSLPEIRLKSGDGIHKYSELPFISAPASDIYEWAKQKNKPQYTADEIIDLKDFKHSHSISDIIGLQEELDKKSEQLDEEGSSSGNIGLGKKIIASADSGLKITETGENINISINKDEVFILDGGNSLKYQNLS